MKKLVPVLVVGLLLCAVAQATAWSDYSIFAMATEKEFSTGPWFTFNNGTTQVQVRGNFDGPSSATAAIGPYFHLWEGRHSSVLDVAIQSCLIAGNPYEDWTGGIGLEVAATFDWMVGEKQGLRTVSTYHYRHGFSGAESAAFHWGKIMGQLGAVQGGVQEQIFVETTGPNKDEVFADIGPSLQMSFGSFTANTWFAWPVAADDEPKLFFTIDWFFKEE